MIQRIQSIFLFLASGSAFGLFAAPFAGSSEALSASALLDDQVYNIYDHIGLLLAFSLAGAVSLASIFLYKNRGLQMRATLLALLLALVGAGLVAAFFVMDSAAKAAGSVDYRLGLALPVLAALFNILAHRSIKKDEKLVRSMDRLR